MKTKSARYWLNLFAAIFAAVALGLGTLVTALSYRQAQAYMRPARILATGDILRARDIPYTEVDLTAEDGVTISAWYTPPENGAVILVAHGHGGCRNESIHVLLAGHGYGVLSWDFRAHGKSGGDFTSLGYYEALDAKAALDFALSQQGVKHIGAWGGSMGAVTMIRATAQYPEIEALVSDSAFSTLQDVLDLRVPYPVINPLVKFFAEGQTGLRLESVRAVDDVGRISPRPVLIVQSSNDMGVPLDSALRLYENADEPKDLWIKDKAHHLGLYSSYPEEYTQRVVGFFDAYFLK